MDIHDESDGDKELKYDKAPKPYRLPTDPQCMSEDHQCKQEMRQWDSNVVARDDTSKDPFHLIDSPFAFSRPLPGSGKRTQHNGGVKNHPQTLVGSGRNDIPSNGVDQRSDISTEAASDDIVWELCLP
ncbi:unnamed protein product [Calypogeia fissa]